MRLVPLLAAGALLLHKLNGITAGAPAGHGHSYLPLAVALVTVLLALTCARYASELWQAARGNAAPVSQPSFVALWALASTALFGTFGLQEWIEGWLTPGHPGTLTHALAHIGWVAPVLAAAIGAAIALVLGLSRSAIVLLAKRRLAGRRRRAARGRWGLVPPPARPRLPVLASNRAGRAPPAISFS